MNGRASVQNGIWRIVTNTKQEYILLFVISKVPIYWHAVREDFL